MAGAVRELPLCVGQGIHVCRAALAHAIDGSSSDEDDSAPPVCACRLGQCVRPVSQEMPL